jgi:hypothetical protein
MLAYICINKVDESVGFMPARTCKKSLYISDFKELYYA